MLGHVEWAVAPRALIAYHVQCTSSHSGSCKDYDLLHALRKLCIGRATTEQFGFVGACMNHRAVWLCWCMRDCSVVFIPVHMTMQVYALASYV